MTESNVHVETRMGKSSKCFTVTFSGISGYPVDPNDYTSSPFIDLDENGTWSVRLYPGGVGACTKHMGCRLAYESVLPTRASFNLTLINQKGWKHTEWSSKGVKRFSSDSKTHGDDAFVEKVDVLNEAKGFCVEDRMVIRVDLIIYSNVEHIIGGTESATSLHCGLLTTPLSSPGRPIGNGSAVDRNQTAGEGCSLPVQLAALLTDESSADVTINVLDSTSGARLCSIAAHKFMLSLRSPVFRAMFACTMQEEISGVLEISDLDTEVVQLMLRYIYTDRLDVATLCATCTGSSSVCEQLLASACKYQIKGLEALCAHHLAGSLNSNNVVSILCLAHCHGASLLKTRALQYIARNAKLLLQTEGFFVSLDFSLCQEVMLQMAGVTSIIPPPTHPSHPPQYQHLSASFDSAATASSGDSLIFSESD